MCPNIVESVCGPMMALRSPSGLTKAHAGQPHVLGQLQQGGLVTLQPGERVGAELALGAPRQDLARHDVAHGVGEQRLEAVWVAHLGTVHAQHRRHDHVIQVGAGQLHARAPVQLGKYAHAQAGGAYRLVLGVRAAPQCQGGGVRCAGADLCGGHVVRVRGHPGGRREGLIHPRFGVLSLIRGASRLSVARASELA